jgi:hypothetical protein
LTINNLCNSFCTGCLAFILTAAGFGVHLEATVGGRLLVGIDSIARGSSYKWVQKLQVPDSVWTWASRNFATYATGPQAIAVIRAAGNTWTRVEKPTLEARKFLITILD